MQDSAFASIVAPAPSSPLRFPPVSEGIALAMCAEPPNESSLCYSYRLTREKKDATLSNMM